MIITAPKKFQDNSVIKSLHQQERKKQSKSHRYENTNNVGSLENFGNPYKTSRNFKGRGSIRYRPLVKGNNPNPSSKCLQSLKLQERTASSSPRRVSSHATATSFETSVTRMQYFASTVDAVFSPFDSLISSSHGIFRTRGSDEKHGRTDRYIPTSMLRGDKHPVSLPNSFLRRKTVSKGAGRSALNVEDSVHPVYDNHFTYLPMPFPLSIESLQLEGETPGFPFQNQNIGQPYPIYITENRVSTLSPHAVIEQMPTTSTVQRWLPLGGQQTLHPGKVYRTLSKSFQYNSTVGTLPQQSNLGHDLVGRSSVVLQRGGGRSSVQPGGVAAFLQVTLLIPLELGANDISPCAASAVQLAGLPNGSIGDHVPSMPPPGSRRCEMTRSRAGTATPYNSNRSPARKIGCSTASIMKCGSDGSCFKGKLLSQFMNRRPPLLAKTAISASQLDHSVD
ncbi:hypothetical protein L6164_007989 [Bauhinia variegata]|uniref:Uncharacterized protein n=1 Tax=Bauhinia variegata TaxID=167791 RepID=A0ACB9PGF6_BAUVA|nr:hypothetical protein L6164_007989 [Bauhinia variegata]